MSSVLIRNAREEDVDVVFALVDRVVRTVIHNPDLSTVMGQDDPLPKADHPRADVVEMPNFHRSRCPQRLVATASTSRSRMSPEINRPPRRWNETVSSIVRPMCLNSIWL